MNEQRKRIPIKKVPPITVKLDFIQAIYNISIPRYNEEVLVIRPNLMTGKNEIKCARLMPAVEDGVNYGKPGEFRPYFGDYWIFPGRDTVMRFDAVTFWAVKPDIKTN